MKVITIALMLMVTTAQAQQNTTDTVFGKTMFGVSSTNGHLAASMNIMKYTDMDQGFTFVYRLHPDSMKGITTFRIFDHQVLFQESPMKMRDSLTAIRVLVDVLHRLVAERVYEDSLKLVQHGIQQSTGHD